MGFWARGGGFESSNLRFRVPSGLRMSGLERLEAGVYGFGFVGHLGRRGAWAFIFGKLGALDVVTVSSSFRLNNVPKGPKNSVIQYLGTTNMGPGPQRPSLLLMF